MVGKNCAEKTIKIILEVIIMTCTAATLCIPNILEFMVLENIPKSNMVPINMLNKVFPG
jgi:hypothetical protein